MLVYCVHVHVKPEGREPFIQATLENARSTVQESGNLRFDVIQQADDPDRFILYEVYRDGPAAKAHKETAHYARWRQAVEPWMGEQRRGVQYFSLFPPDPQQWKTPATV